LDVCGRREVERHAARWVVTHFLGGGRGADAVVAADFVNQGETKMEKGFVATFERQVLFRISRFVAFSICFLLFLSLVGGALYLLKSGHDASEKPDPSAVAQALKPAPEQAAPAADAADATAGAGDASDGATGTSLASQPALFGVKLPPVLQEQFLNEDNQKILRDWLDSLPEGERQPFIDGLAKTVEEARKVGVADADAINRYHEQYVEYVTSRTVAQAAAKTQRLYVAGALISILVLLALFSLVLVLLAIERNTRPLPAAGANQ
jgi:hypothetical protein